MRSRSVRANHCIPSKYNKNGIRVFERVPVKHYNNSKIILPRCKITAWGRIAFDIYVTHRAILLSFNTLSH